MRSSVVRLLGLGLVLRSSKSDTTATCPTSCRDHPAYHHVASAGFKDTCVVLAISLVAFTGGIPQHGLGQIQAPAPDPRQADRHADSDSQMATQLYQAADTAVESATSLQGCSSSEDDGRCTRVEAVAEAVIQQGCWDEEGRAVQLIKPFLPAALSALTQAHACRYVGYGVKPNNDL